MSRCGRVAAVRTAPRRLGLSALRSAHSAQPPAASDRDVAHWLIDPCPLPFSVPPSSLSAMSSRSKSSSKSAAGAAPSPKLSAAASPSAIAAEPSPAAPAASSSSASASASSATLQVFWDLAKEEAGERAAACQLLLSSLAAEQQSYLASGGAKKAAAAAAAKAKLKAEDSMDDDDDDGEHEADAPLTNTVLPTTICPSLAYALKRLTRGLASSRAGARQGFALALTEVRKSNKQ